MKINFKFQPVVWLTAVAIVLGALLKADEQFHVLPAGVAHWVAYLVAVAGLILTAWQAWRKVTPLADPRAANGRPLVPVPPAQVPSGASPDALDAERDH